MIKPYINGNIKGEGSDIMIKVNIDRILEEQGKTMYWLAQVTNLTYPTIYKLVANDTKSISFDTLYKICIALNCKIEDILKIE